MVWYGMVWYGDDVEMVVCRSPGSKPGSGMGMGGICVGMVLKLDYTVIYLIC